MKSAIAVAAFAGLAAAWGPPGTTEGSWGTKTAWKSGQTWTPTAWTSIHTTYPAWNSTTPTGTGTGASSGVGAHSSTGSPIATGGVDNSKPMVGGLLAIAGVLAAL